VSKRVFFFLIATVGVLAGCCSATRGDVAVKQAASRTDEAPQTRFSGLQPSLDVLGRRFLSALESSDEASLRAIAITKYEFERNVWPKLPASEPGSNLSSEWVWNQYALKNESSLSRLLRRFGGKQYEFAGFEFRGETRDYGEFLLHTEAVLRVAENGEEKRVRLIGSVIEEAGQFKIYGFVVD
jgi:hypothetical protein